MASILQGMQSGNDLPALHSAFPGLANASKYRRGRGKWYDWEGVRRRAENFMGESDVIDAPQIAPIAPSQNDRWRREYLAFIRLLPELLETHRNQYVAIQNGGIVAVGDTFEDAAIAAYKRCGYVPLHVGLVSDAISAPVRLPSARIARSQ